MSSTPVMDRLIRRTVEGSVPLNVHFDLTYRCNERCVHCYLDHEDYGELNTGEVQGILEQLAGAGTLFLTYSGGEVFLRGDFLELVRYARGLHFDVSVKTNGLRVTRQRARELKGLGVRRVQISIYSGEAAIHDGITKVAGSLERSLQAVGMLKAEGLAVKLACPLMKQNLLGYRGVVELAAELGVGYMLDLTITPRLAAREMPATIATGAARIKGHGVATTRTARARTGLPETAHARPATPSVKGRNHMA